MARSIMRVFLLVVLSVFLTGISVFADEIELTTIVTKEMSGIDRIRIFPVPPSGPFPNGPPALSYEPPELYPDGPDGEGGPLDPSLYYPSDDPVTVDLAADPGGHALKDKTLISLTGGGTVSAAFTYGCTHRQGNEYNTKSYGTAGAITTPPTVISVTLDGTATYIESFTVSNIVGGDGTYGIINAIVIEYN